MSVLSNDDLSILEPTSPLGGPGRGMPLALGRRKLVVVQLDGEYLGQVRAPSLWSFQGCLVFVACVCVSRGCGVLVAGSTRASHLPCARAPSFVGSPHSHADDNAPTA